MSEGDATAGSKPLSSSRHLVRWGSILLIGVFLLIVFLPWIAGNTRVLNYLVSNGLSQSDIDAKIGSASLGWFRSAQLHRIQLVDQQDRWEMTADEAATGLTLWQLIWSQGNLGEFKLKGPTVTINASRPWPHSAPAENAVTETSSSRDGSLRVTIEDGTVLVRTKDLDVPQEFVTGLNVTVDYLQDAGKRTVMVAPGRPIERAQLTPEMCNLGIKYVVPVLADVTWVKGAMSLELDECQIPLDAPQDAYVVGRLEIEAVESGLQKGIADQVMAIVSRLDLARVPESVKLAQNSIVEFHVADGRVEHRDLAFGLPEINPDLVITTNGTVGMDSSLDLVATLPPIGEWLGDGLIGQAMRSQRLSLPVTGTLDDPQVSVDGHQQIVGSLLNQLVPGLNADQLLNDEEFDLAIDEVGETVVDVLELLRNQRQRMREQRQIRRNQRPSDADVNQEAAPNRGGFLETRRERLRQIQELPPDDQP